MVVVSFANLLACLLAVAYPNLFSSPTCCSALNCCISAGLIDTQAVVLSLPCTSSPPDDGRGPTPKQSLACLSYRSRPLSFLQFS